MKCPISNLSLSVILVKTIFFTGHIFSLGNLQGSVLYITDEKQDVLASFKFKKQ